MAATGKTPILLYGSTTASNVPVAGNLTNSSDGCEIAINVADKNLFFKDSTNTVNTVPIRQSSASSNGWLSSTDWSTFNGKQPAGSYALTTGTLAQFASTTSAQLAGVISDETGSGSLVFSSNPTFSGGTNSTHLTVGPAGSRQVAISTAVNGIYDNAWMNFSYNSSVGGYQFLNSVSTLASLDNAGNLTLPVGNLVIGTSGKGIDFSATSQPASGMTSELLADYEEGTWTPTQGAGLTVVGSFSSAGYYTKVGRLVTVNGYVAGSTSVASGSGGIFCGGLPYVAQIYNVGSCRNAGYTVLGGIATAFSNSNLYSVENVAATTSIAFTITYWV